MTDVELADLASKIGNKIGYTKEEKWIWADDAYEVLKVLNETHCIVPKSMVQKEIDTANAYAFTEEYNEEAKHYLGLMRQLFPSMFNQSDNGNK